jgi:hypothetical protein
MLGLLDVMDVVDGIVDEAGDEPPRSNFRRRSFDVFDCLDLASFLLRPTCFMMCVFYTNSFVAIQNSRSVVML